MTEESGNRVVRHSLTRAHRTGLRVASRCCTLIPLLVTVAACSGLGAPPPKPVPQAVPPTAPPAVPDRVVLDEGDFRLERLEWFLKRRRGSDGSLPPDLFGREVRAWEAWSGLHRKSAEEATATPFTNRIWKEMGPRNIAGRVLSVAFDPTSVNTVWAGSAGGGLWRSTDFGLTWQQMGGDQLPSLWIGAIAIDPHDPNVVYMGTGEDNTNYGGYGGFGGMLKTTDGGKTFTSLPIPAGGFARTVISSADSKQVMAAATNGVYRSADAGDHFEQVTGGPISDLVQDPKDSSRFLAVRSAGFGWFNSGIYESLDAGKTWNPIGAATLPDPGQWGRSAIAIAPAPSPNAFLAFGQKIGGVEPPRLFRSTDNGHTWQQWAQDRDRHSGYVGVGWYGAHLYVAPWDADTVYQANGNSLLTSHDGGLTWKGPEGNWHIDTHGFDLTRLDRTHMLLATDGGVAVSSDGGFTFNRADAGFPTVQYYSCAIGLADAVTLFGGTQDNCMNAYRGAGGGAWEFTYPPGFCDVGSISVNPAATQEVVAVTAGIAGIGFSSDGGRTWTDSKHMEEGGPWAARIARSALNPQHVYLGGHHLDVSADGGRTWQQIAVRPDLQRTVEDVSVSPVSDQEIWTIWDDAKVFVSQDGGATWTDSSPPAARYQSGTRISAGPAPGNAYALLGRPSGPRLFRSHDGGRNWSDISKGLPDLTLNSVIADPRKAGRLYVATDAGVAFSDDDGNTWSDASGELPRAVMWDLCLDPASGRMAVGSYGRGIWELAPPPPCSPSATSLCLNNGRFEVTATWQTATDSGTAQVVPLTTDTGYLYFFNASNVEAVVKMVDGCGLNNEFWVFAGGLTNVKTKIKVRDIQTGIVKTYINPQNTPFQPIQDTSAFATCAAPSLVPPDPAGAGDKGLTGSPAWLSVQAQATSGTSLLLGNGRFKVDVTWRAPGGQTGMGNPVSLTGDTGYFWFFDSSKVEMVIKILNACGLNQNYWVFAGGLTNVETTIKVTDTLSGASKSYVNPQNTPFQPIQDTSALATCP